MVTVLSFLGVLLILVLVHEFGHYIVAKKSGMYVEEFGFGLPPRLWGKKIGETLYSLNVLPLGGFVKIFGEEHSEQKAPARLDPAERADLVNRSFSHKPWQVRAAVIAAGPLMNFLFAVLLLSILFTKGIWIPTTDVRIEEVQSGSPAQSVGLQKNDIIRRIEVGGEVYDIQLTSDVSRYTNQYKGRELRLIIERNEDERAIMVTPRTRIPKGQGALGIAISQTVYKKVPWYKAPIEGTKSAFALSRDFYKELGRALYRIAQFENPRVVVTGPVGIAQITSQAAQSGIATLALFLALFSLNLFLINLLPFPALDGGQLVFVAIEAIRKKPISAHIKQRVNTIGFAILISLMILITIKDVRDLVR